MKAYIVWNEARTEGFVTVDKQLAYEVRKSASSNCFDQDGRQSTVGQAFCEAYVDDNCTTEEVEVQDAPRVTADPVRKGNRLLCTDCAFKFPPPLDCPKCGPK
jgi:5-methylcytosine-specific restriction endonuclease McrA